MRLRTAVAGLVLLIALAAGAIPVWLSLDHAAPHGDYVRYLTTTHRIAQAISHPDAQLIERIMKAHAQPYPPLFAAAAALFHLADPSSVDAPVYAQMLFVALLAVGCFGIGRALRGPGTGLLAAFLMLTTTHVAVYGHLMMLEIPLAAMTAIAVWAYLESDGFRWLGPSLAFGAAAGLAVLVKWNAAFAWIGVFAMYAAAVPRFAFAARGGADRDDLRRRAMYGAGAFALAAVMIFPWAWLRGGDLWEYTSNVREQNLFHVGTSILDGESLRYYIHAIRTEASNPDAWAIAAAVLALIAGEALRPRGGAPASVAFLELPERTRTRALLIIAAGLYVALTAIPAKETRYAGPLLALAAPLLAAATTGLRIPGRPAANRAARALCITLLAVLGIVGFLGAAFDVGAGDDLRLRAAQVLAVGPVDFRVYQPEDPPKPFLPEPGRTTAAVIRLKHAPDPRNPEPERAVEAVARDRVQGNAIAYAVTPQTLLHASALAYFAEASYPNVQVADVREYYVASPRDVEYAAASPYEYWTATHLIHARLRSGADAFSQSRTPFAAGLSAWLDRKPPVASSKWQLLLSYEPIHDPFDKRFDLIVDVYRRTAPADDAEVAETLAAIESFDRLKPGVWVEVAMLYSLQKRPDDALRVLKDHVQHTEVLSPFHRSEAERIYNALTSR